MDDEARKQDEKTHMEPEMQYLRAPQENLQTWSRITKLFIYSSVTIAVVLLLMAAFLA